MTKKQREDNRDVFEKALDYAPAIGAVAGGALGGKIGRWSARRSLPDGPKGVRAGDLIITDKGVRKATAAEAKKLQALDRKDVTRGTLKGAAIGGVLGGVSGQGAGDFIKNNRRK